MHIRLKMEGNPKFNWSDSFSSQSFPNCFIYYFLPKVDKSMLTWFKHSSAIEPTRFEHMAKVKTRVCIML